MNFKLIYIANARIPTEKAHGIQIMNMCAAFVTNGVEVELVLPDRLNEIKKDPFDYYGLKPSFKITKLPAIDLIKFDLPILFFLETLSFGVSLFFYLLLKKDDCVLYTRGEMILVLRPFLAKWPTFWETHIRPENFKPYQKIIDKIKGLVVVTEYYKKVLVEELSAPEQKVLFAPDGVDLERFDISITKEEARKRLKLPLDKKIILYTGSFLSWKGTDIFLEISGFLPNDVLLVLVAGGEKEDIERFKKSINNLSITNFLILEHRPHEEIPYYLKAADVLILTGTQKSEISLHYTSPLKLFEYMASQRPILATDISSFGEVLNENNSFFYKPDRAEDFIQQLNFIFNNSQLAEMKAKQAFKDVQNFTWQKRAGKILDFICDVSE